MKKPEAKRSVVQTERKTPEVDMTRFPAGTHCLAAARTLAIPVIECPRRPSHRVPFCWLAEDGAEHWLVHSCSATDAGLQDTRHQQMIRVMCKCVDNGRIVVLLYGRNEPTRYEGRLIDTGYPEFHVFHELFTEQGSVARHSAVYAKWWADPASFYREFMVPGPEKLPDSELAPLVAKNRCYLLPPTEPRESLWTLYGGKSDEGPQYDDEGNLLPPKPKPPRQPRQPRATLPQKGAKPAGRAAKAPPAPKAKKEPAPRPEKAPKKPKADTLESMIADVLGKLTT